MIVYIPEIPNHAGRWIYNGYAAAWGVLGHQVKRYVSLEEIDTGEMYYLMAFDGQVYSTAQLKYFLNAQRAFLYVQPDNFPRPWGGHPNFFTTVVPKVASLLNKLDSVHLWTFSDVKEEYYTRWDNIRTLPLAFDTQSYDRTIVDPPYFDVCYIGSRADNGFNEKIKIMYSHFKAFKDSGLRCGFFIDKHLSHQQEQEILTNTRVPINIHDAYQRQLGTDCNERTFKSLGLNGVLVMDRVAQAERIFGDRVRYADSPSQMVEKVMDILEGDDSIDGPANRSFIYKNHTYFRRVQTLLSWQ